MSKFLFCNADYARDIIISRRLKMNPVCSCAHYIFSAQCFSVLHVVKYVPVFAMPELQNGALETESEATFVG
jgi:hypothetical protein